MAIYAIGDVQGCYAELQKLLLTLPFNSQHDTLWFTGDIVNRGPQSLEVLRFVKSLGERQITVLGNHDLHLIAAAYGTKRNAKGDTLEAILDAPDGNELITWLRHQPLLHHDKDSGYVMTHAGLAPMWTLHQAKQCAQEVETVLRGDAILTFLQNMYGNQPNKWQEQLTGFERLRCIVNYFTRMRFCYADGSLDLVYKGEIAGKPDDLIPWFEVKDRANLNDKIIFGHWAALNGRTEVANVFPLDTGCVWGNCLTAMRLDDGKHFSVTC